MKPLIKASGALIIFLVLFLSYNSSAAATGKEDKDENLSGKNTGSYILEGREDKKQGMYDQYSNEVEIVAVTKNIYMLTVAGGNMHIVAYIGKDGILLIDDLLPGFNEDIVKTLKTLSDKPIKFVINSHWHWDHTGGNEQMAKAGALIIAQESVMDWMTTWQVSGMSGAPKAPQPPMGLPAITFKEDLTLRFNGSTIVISNAGPAHTAGDAIVHFVEDDVYVMGDVYLSGSYPSIDLNTGGDIKGIISALDKVLGKAGPDTIIIAGHGKLSDGRELREFRNMAEDVYSRVHKAIDNGKTLEDILAMKLTTDLDKKWANFVMTPEVVVKFIYNSIKKSSAQ